MKELEKSKIKWYSKTSDEVLKELATDLGGLSSDEAKRRAEKYGLNVLPEGKMDSLFVIFLRQFKSPLIYLLLAAMLVMGVLGEWADAVSILVVLVLNAVIGCFQEGKAQNTLKALKQLVTTNATVMRDGKEIVIPDSEVVVGDILVLQEGEKITADARVINSTSLSANEAALTGESLPVLKDVDAIAVENNLAAFAQSNMVFKGTDIVMGSGLAVAVNTGINTEIGRISVSVSGEQTQMPLQVQIEKFSEKILWAVGVFSVLLFGIGIFTGKGYQEMFFTVVALSVSIVPEGLPVVITLVLATGVWRMSKRNALIKKLQAVESLGQATIIASDKTGTLTRNELQVEKILCDHTVFEIKGYGYDPNGQVILNGSPTAPLLHPILQNAALTATLCTKASVKWSEKNKKWEVVGDPTEAALIVFAKRLGLNKESLVSKYQLLAEIPFDYNRKFRAVVYAYGGHSAMYVVGAPEVVINKCALPAEEKERILKMADEFAKQGLRVLAGAYREDVKNVTGNELPELTYAAVFALSDSLHEEVPETVAKLDAAGARVVMITGDNPLTAESIGRKAGIFTDGDLIMTGKELEDLKESDVLHKLPKVSVFARVTPEHKLKLIELYRRLGNTVAMTGDGVNDAPALVKADLGIAMGITGTSVTKEAADIILLDDKLSSVAAAVEEGRSIYQTIRKVIIYLFSTNVGEAGVITLAILFAMPLPLLPTQIIWMNFVTDGFLTIALGMEKKESGLLGMKPKKGSLLDKQMLFEIVIMSIPMIIGSLLLFSHYYKTDLDKAVSITLTTMVVFQWFRSWSCRDREKSIFLINPFSNLWWVASIVIVVFLQLLALHNTWLSNILHTVPLNYEEWVTVLLVGSSVVWVEEIRKAIYKKRKK